jgi:hypothetical protein
MSGQFVDDDGRRRSAQWLSTAVSVQCGTAPVDINFKAWIPTAQGIELHFPEFQFGGGLKVVTVPWATVTDQIRPEFTPITGG